MKSLVNGRMVKIDIYILLFYRSDLSQKVERVLQGIIDENCPVNSRVIRIFLSSTFTGNDMFTLTKPFLNLL